jgi:hypothetical protein
MLDLSSWRFVFSSSLPLVEVSFDRRLGDAHRIVMDMVILIIILPLMENNALLSNPETVKQEYANNSNWNKIQKYCAENCMAINICYSGILKRWNFLDKNLYVLKQF